MFISQNSSFWDQFCTTRNSVKGRRKKDQTGTFGVDYGARKRVDTKY